MGRRYVHKIGCMRNQFHRDFTILKHDANIFVSTIKSSLSIVVCHLANITDEGLCYLEHKSNLW